MQDLAARIKRLVVTGQECHRSPHRTALLLCLLLSFLAHACGDKVASRPNVSSSSSFRVEVIQGNDLEGMPRQPFDQNIVFEVRDVNGKAVVGAVVGVGVVNVTGAANVAWGSLSQALKSKLPSIGLSPAEGTSPSALNAEETAGRVVNAPSRTDAEGRVSVRYRAPYRFGQKVALAAWLGASPSVDTAHGIAILRTKPLGKGVKVTLVTTTQEAETAGMPFDINLRLVDASGAIDRTFDGEFTFALTHDARASWAGKLPRLPKEFTCRFVAGTCAVPEGPFQLAAVGDVKILLRESTNTLAPSETLVKSKSSGTPAAIVVSDATADSAAERPMEKIALTAGTALKLRAVSVDLAGNRLGEVTDALWSPVNDQLSLTFSSTSESQTTVTPRRIGSGGIKVTSQKAALSSEVRVEVASGPVAGFRATSEVGSTLTAGPCVPLDLEAVDLEGNRVVTFNGAANATLTLRGHDAGTPVLGRTAFRRAGRSTGDSVTLSTTLERGFASSVVDLCPFKATAFSMESNSPEGKVDSAMSVIPGVAKLVLLSRTPENEGLTPACLDMTDPGNLLSPCVGLSSDRDSERLHVMITDTAGNILPASADFTLSTTGPVASSGSIAWSSDRRALDLQPGNVGKGFLTVAHGNLATRYAYETVPGERHTLAVSVSGPAAFQGRRVTVAPLNVELSWYDRKGNQISTYQGAETLSLELIDAGSSPSGAPPITTMTTQAVFTAGVANVSSSLQAVRATDLPRVKVTTSRGSFLSEPLALSPGPITTISLRSAPGGQGQALTAAREIPIFSVVPLFSAGYDALENYVSDPSVTFAGSTAPFTNALSSLEGTSSVFSPAATGQGTVRITTTDPSFSPALAFESGAFSVTARSATRYVVNTSNNLEELAGAPFDILIDATDSEGNVDPLYAGVKSLTLASLANRSFRGDLPLMPQGEMTCTFVAGRCTLPPPFGQSWKLMDAESPSAITVSDVTGVIPGAWSALVQVSKGAPAELILADKTGGPSNQAKAYDLTVKKIMTVDDTLALNAAVLDAAGNWIKDANVTWSANAAAITDGFSASTGPSILLAPRKTVRDNEDGKILVSFSESGVTLAAQWALTIDHGVPTRIAIQTQGGVTSLPVGECTSVDFEVVDRYDNVAYFYSLQTPLRIGVKNLRDPSADHSSHPFRPGLYFFPTSSNAPYMHLVTFVESDPVYSTGDFFDPVLGYRQGGVMTGAAFVQGKLTSPMTLCVTDSGPNVAPEVVAQLGSASLPGTNLVFPALSGTSGALSVPNGSPHFVAVRLEGTALTCAPPPISNPYNFWAVNDFNAISAPYTTAGSRGSWRCPNTNHMVGIDVPVQESLRLTATVHDKGGTKLRNASGDFLTVLKPATESATPVANGFQLDFQARVGDWNSGQYFQRPIRYMFQFRDTQATTPLYSDVIQLGLTPSDAVALTAGAVGEVAATNPFSLSLAFKDAYGNATGKNAPASISVSAGGTALPSPSGVAATVPASITVELTEGGGTAMVTSPLFQLPRANALTTLTFTPDARPLIPARSIVVSPVPGPPVRMFLAPQGQTSVEAASPLVQDTITNTAFVSGVKDALDNPTLNYDVDAIATGIVAEMLGSASSRRSAFDFQPEGSGTGSLTLADPNGLLPQVNYAVNVNYTPVDRIAIQLEDGGVPVSGALEAGKAYDVRLQALDADLNVQRSFSGQKLVSLSLARLAPNVEGTFDGLNVPSGNLITFANGVSAVGQLTFTPRTTSGLQALEASYTESGSTAVGRLNITNVTPGPFDHYGVEIGADPRSDYPYTARNPQSETFSATIRWRDALGNPTPSGPSGTVSLVLRRDDGVTAAPGSLSGTTAGIEVTAAGTTVSNLSYNAPGRFRVVALNGPSGTPASASTRIDAAASLQAVVSYGIGWPGGGSASVASGVAFFFQITARDAYGQAITGIDSGLSAQSFTLTGAPATAGGQTSTMPSTLSFAGGVALAPVTLFKTGTLPAASLTFSDSSLRQGTNPATIVVQGGTVARYEITTTSPLSRTADTDPTTGLFNLTVRALDLNGNVTPGEPGLELKVTRVDGDTSKYTGSISLANGATFAPVLTPVSTTGEGTFNNLFYASHGAIVISLQGTTLPVVGGGVQMNFTHTMKSLEEYWLQVNGTGSPTQVDAGPGNVSVQIRAVDWNGNVLEGLDSSLNALNFVWRGPTASLGGNAPVLPTPVFSGGVAQVTLSLYAAQSFAGGMLQLDDGATPNPRRGSNGSALTVRALAPTTLAGSYPSSATAGTPLAFNIRPRDLYGNPSASGCGTLSLTGATASPGSQGLAATQPSVPTSLSLSVDGDYGISNLLLYRAGTESLTAAACGLTHAFSVSVGPAENTLLQLQDSAAATASPIGAVTLTAGSVRDWYLASYDAYGNQRGPVPANFSSSTGSLTLATISTGVVRVTAPTSGTAVLTATPTNGLGPVATGTITVVPSAVATFEVVPLGAAGTGTVVAGTPISIEIRALDASGNIATGFSGSKALAFSSSTTGANAEGRGLVLPAGGTYTFTDGVLSAPVTAVAHNASTSAQITVAHSSGGTNVFGATTLTVNAGAFHHYGVVSDASYSPTWNRANTFSSTVTLRDASGNILSSGGPATAITLRIVKADGSAATGTLGGTTSLSAPAPSAVASDLNYDEAGSFKVIADDDGNPATLETPLSASTTVFMGANLALVKAYNLQPTSTTVTAGSVLPFTVTALDAYNRPVPGLDAELGALNFSLTGPGNAPNGTAPTLPANSSLAFSGGVATALTTLRKAETLAAGALVLTDNRPTPMSASNTVALTVISGTVARYMVSSSDTARNADFSASGTFSLTVTAVDPFENITAGESGLSLTATRVSGPSNTTSLRTAGGSALATFNLAGGSSTFSGLSYPVGQSVTFGVSGTTLSSSPVPTMTFTPTLGTVKEYAIAPGSNPVTAGVGNVAVTVRALDYGNNTILGIDAQLDALTYSWQGAGTSPSPASHAPSYGNNTGTSGKLAFVNGVASGITHSFYRAETIAAGSFKIVDSNTVQGAYGFAFVVNPATADTLSLSGFSTTQTAGTGFTAVASVRDLYANLTNVGCGTLTTSYTGLTAPLGATPTIATDVAQGVVGQYSVPMQLVKSGANAVTFNACGKSADTTITVNETGTSYMAVRVGDSTTPGSVADATPSPVQCANSSASSAAVTCPTLYSFMWDTYGNRVDPLGSTCTWSYANVSGSTTPTVSGGAFAYTFTHSNWIDGKLRCTRDSKSIDVPVYGGASRLALSHDYTAPVNVGNGNVTMSSVTVYQRSNNVEIAKNDAGTVTLALSKTNYSALAFGTGAGTVGQPSSIACSFNGSGVCTGPFAFNLTASAPALTPATITVSLFGLSQDIGPMTIHPTAATNLLLTGLPTTATAGAAINGMVVARDTFNNATDVGCGTMSITGTGLASQGRTESASQSPTLPSGVALSSTTGTYDTGNFTLFKKGANVLTVNACNLTANHTVTVAPGALSTLIVTTSNTATATNASTDVYCPHTAATGTNVACNLYAFPWDAFGNAFDSPNDVCTWTYSSNGGGAVAPSLTPASGGSAHGLAVTATDFIDGQLSCVNGSFTRTFNLYGGTSSLAVTSHTYNGTSIVANATAGSSINVSQVTLYARKGGSNVARPAYGASETVTASTTHSQGIGTGGNTINVPSTTSCTFNASGQCALSHQSTLKIVATNASLTYDVRGKQGSITNINVTPANVSQLVFTSPGTQTAGTAFTLTVTPRDPHGNDSVVNCAAPQTLVVTAVSNTTSPGATHGGTATGATLPGSAVSLGASSFSVPLTLFNGGTNGAAAQNNTLGFQLTCNGTNAVSSNYDVAVQALSTPNLVRLSSTNAIPSSNLDSYDCGGSAAVSSPSCALYAFAWDQYGNNIQGNAWSCPAWSYTNASSALGTTPTLSSGSGTSTTLSNANNHIDASVTCAAASGSVTATTAVFRKITRSVSHTCGAWSCAVDNTPQATCTVSNSSNYGVASVSIGAGAPGLVSTGCTGSIAHGSNCTYAIQGTAGSAPGTWGVIPTEASPSAMTFTTPQNVTVSTAAPNCTNILNTNVSPWSCSAGNATATVTFTNPNSVTAVPMPAGGLSFTTAAGATTSSPSASCSSTIAANNGTCTATVVQPSSGQTSVLTASPTSIFQAADATLTNSPNCTQTIAFVSSVEKTACSGPGGSKSVTVTLRNDNGIFNAVQSSLTAGSATISNSTCGSISKNGGTCSFDLTWSSTPTSTSNASVTWTPSSYFNALTVGSGQIDNTCGP